MIPVIQKEETGCGIAAVATIVQQTYSSVKLKANAIGIFAEDEKLFSATHHIRKLLRDYGIKTSDTEIPFSSWDKLPDLALLAIQYHKEESRHFWHWVVFQRTSQASVVLDSAPYLENNVRKDFDTMLPKWSIAILDTSEQAQPSM